MSPPRLEGDGLTATEVMLMQQDTHRLGEIHRLKDQLERTRALVCRLEQELAKERAAGLRLTGYQLKVAADLTDDPETELRIARREAGTVEPDSPGDPPSPAGLWAEYAECPEEGVVFLPKLPEPDSPPCKCGYGCPPGDGCLHP